MSPSDLHHFPGIAHQSSASPLPLPQQQPVSSTSAPSPAAAVPSAQPPQQERTSMYASPNAFAHQPFPYSAAPPMAQQPPPESQSTTQHLHQQPSPYPPPSSASPFPDHPPPSAVTPYPPHLQQQQPPPIASTSQGSLPPPIPSTSSEHQPSPFPPPPPTTSTSAVEGGGEDQKPTPPSGPPPAPPIAVMTKEQQKHAINLVRNLKRNKNAAPFLKPVDHIALHIPDYYKIITYPMDLGTVESRLQATGKAMTNTFKLGRIYGLDYSYGSQGPDKWEGIVPEGFEPKGYRTVQEFKHDLDKIWENCFRYNGPREKNPVSAMAGLMMDAAEKSYRGMPYSPAVEVSI